MRIEEISKNIDGRILVGNLEADFQNYYAGDFLSRVISKAPEKCAWLTVMNNVNVAGVAVLAEIKLIILCEGVKPTAELYEKCEKENIGIIVTDYGVYETCKRL